MELHDILDRRIEMATISPDLNTIYLIYEKGGFCALEADHSSVYVGGRVCLISAQGTDALENAHIESVSASGPIIDHWDGKRYIFTETTIGTDKGFCRIVSALSKGKPGMSAPLVQAPIKGFPDADSRRITDFTREPTYGENDERKRKSAKEVQGVRQTADTTEKGIHGSI